MRKADEKGIRRSKREESQRK